MVHKSLLLLLEEKFKSADFLKISVPRIFAHVVQTFGGGVSTWGWGEGVGAPEESGS